MVFHRVSLAGPAQGAVQAMCLMNHAESHLEGHPVEKNNQFQEPEREQQLETLFADPRRHCGQYVGEANHPRRRQVTPAESKRDQSGSA